MSRIMTFRDESKLSNNPNNSTSRIHIGKRTKIDPKKLLVIDEFRNMMGRTQSAFCLNPIPESKYERIPIVLTHLNPDKVLRKPQTGSSNQMDEFYF
jgi:hypothetical protein